MTHRVQVATASAGPGGVALKGSTPRALPSRPWNRFRLWSRRRRGRASGAPRLRECTSAGEAGQAGPAGSKSSMATMAEKQTKKTGSTKAPYRSLT
jgi:hypothetical protein